MAYMLKRPAGFRLFLDDGRIDIDSNRRRKRDQKSSHEPPQCSLCRATKVKRPELGSFRKLDRHMQDEWR
ncbi:hypothetical protein J2Z31_005570 [Sinorhizobium kostiense]|uniref:Uncharacterized protein n=1 Tax=Sinorhizobium kostiense TaxID=76747 RepID=A0ABS4R8K4_9HYPH|nr:hypothetical protein [Sinorhizobium kostiense]